MGCSRQALLDIGGFDERMRPVGEDDDLGFRWLRSGRPLRYAPEFKVCHTAWRTEAEVRRMYRLYAQGDGTVYAKYLLEGELIVLRYIASDLLWGVVAEIQAAILRKRRSWDHRLETLPNLFIGFWRGLHMYWPRRSRTFDRA
jgi:GT2 family glycosyltransferase